MRRFITLPSFNAVAAGGTATIDLPADGTYHQLRLEYKTGGSAATEAQMRADLGEIRLKLNGKVQQRFTAAQYIDAVLKYRGLGVTAGYLPIFLAEPWRRTALGEDGLAWGMGNVATFQIEVDIKATATTPTLSAKAVWHPARTPIGQIVKRSLFVVPVATTGVHNFSTLPKTNGNYFAMHAFSADVSEVDIKWNGYEVLKAKRDDWHDYIRQAGNNTPQASVFHIDFSGGTNRVSEVLPMVTGDLNGKGQLVNAKPVSDFRVDFTMGAPTPFTLLTETVGNPA